MVDEGAGRLRMEADQGEAIGIPVVMVSKQDGEREATTRPIAVIVSDSSCERWLRDNTVLNATSRGSNNTERAQYSAHSAISNACSCRGNLEKYGRLDLSGDRKNHGLARRYRGLPPKQKSAASSSTEPSNLVSAGAAWPASIFRCGFFNFERVERAIC